MNSERAGVASKGFSCVWVCAWKAVLLLALLCLLLILALFQVVLSPSLLVSQKPLRRITRVFNRAIVLVAMEGIRTGSPESVAILNGNLKKISARKRRPRGKTSYLLISNHICAADTFITAYISHRVLNTETKYVVKESIAYIPLLGWSMKFMNYLFLTRNWAKDQDRVRKWCARVQGERGECLVVYPEGTRRTPENYRRSVEYCLGRNLPVFRHLLFPRTKGFSALIQYLPKNFSHVVHAAITYSENGEPAQPPSLLRLLTCPVPGRFSVVLHMDRVEGIGNPSEYVISSFQEKDSVISRVLGTKSGYLDILE